MSEQIHENDLLPISELLARDDVVYHAIGADIVALDGIASHGLASRETQVELTGEANSNSPHSLAKNGVTMVSVAKAPREGLPNLAFMTYAENSPITFAIDVSGQEISQPPGRGFYDEAFISGAPLDSVTGVVLNANTKDLPYASLPIVTGNTSADMVAAKARHLLNHLEDNYNVDRLEAAQKLEQLLNQISHLTTENLQYSLGMIADDDRNTLNNIDKLLQGCVAAGLAERYGDPDITVQEVVKDRFPDKPLYVNDHSANIELYDEPEYFDTLDSETTIGYERFDGAPGRPSPVKLRRMAASSAVFRALSND